VYFHGGAFVVGSVNLMDAVARELTHATGAVVVSVDYRLAPEHPFPAGLDDCHHVATWVLANASRLGVPAASTFLAGESAGGNLATALTLRLRDEGVQNVTGQVLIYPCTDGPRRPYSSREQFGHSDWVWDTYGGGRDLSDEPYALPLRADSLQGLPPALVLLAGCDALRDEGRAYAERLRAEGVETEEYCYAGQPHGSVNYGLPAAASAYERIADWVSRHTPPRTGVGAEGPERH